jgi:hypothetical protein
MVPSLQKNCGSWAGKEVIEHHPWVGSLYETEGFAGQRLGIVGYSHWTNDDHAGFTVECMRNVVSGAWNISFFNSIARYFGMTTTDFYERVMMFEFVPCAIGGGDERYAVATREQAERGRSRMLEIAAAHRIDKLVIFTAKGWRASPKTVQEQGGRPNLPLGATGFSYGHYEIAGRTVPAIGLRHPQYASAKRMELAVQAALAL